jgi:uncharacterized membrane protein YidH (DUF202 family)
VLLIFLGAPISAVLLGLGVSLFTYGRLRFLGTQMAVRPGHGQSDDRRQEYQESGLLAAALGIASLCIFYLFVAERSWHVHFQTWQVLVAALVIEALALVVTIRWYRGIDHYLGQLPRAERQDAVHHRVRSVRDSLGLWLIVVIIALIAGLSPGFPPRSSNQWADGSALAVLAIWPLLDAVDYLLTTRWQKRLRAAAT